MTMPTPVEIKKSFSAARILGNGDDRVTLSENELFCLLAQCCNDLAIPNSISKLPPVSSPPPNADYYRLPLAWFQSAQANCPSAAALVESLAACVAHEADFRLYFENLATLHKRRLKYQRILSSQPKPTMNQVGPPQPAGVRRRGSWVARVVAHLAKVDFRCGQSCGAGDGLFI